MTDNGDHRLHKPGVTGSNPVAAIESNNGSNPDAEIVGAEERDPRVVYTGTPVGTATLWRIPPEVYFGPTWAHRLSASDLKEFSFSPLAFYGRKVLGSAPKKESEAMRYGERLHTWHELSDPLFWDCVEIASEKDVTATGNLSKKGEEWLAGLPPGKIGLAPAVRDRLWNQTRGILKNPITGKLFDNRVDTEFCLQFDWEGHPMRCRIDGATEQCFYDLKTTSDPNPRESFWRAARDFQYDLQSAVYEAAAEAAGWEPHPLVFIVTSNAWPHLCSVGSLPRDVVAKARTKALRLLDEIRERRDWNSWLPDDYGQIGEFYCPPFMRGESANGWGE